MSFSSLLLLACLVSGDTSAQVLTGALVGTVKDEQGGAVAGALVRVYTFSRASDLQASSGASASDPQVSTVAPAFPTATFGRDPNNLTNANGRLPNDRPHMFRLMGTIDVAHARGLSLAGNLQYFTGKPWAATAQVLLPQGDQRILLSRADRGGCHRRPCWISGPRTRYPCGASDAST